MLSDFRKSFSIATFFLCVVVKSRERKGKLENFFGDLKREVFDEKQTKLTKFNGRWIRNLSFLNRLWHIRKVASFNNLRDLFRERRAWKVSVVAIRPIICPFYARASNYESRQPEIEQKQLFSISSRGFDLRAMLWLVDPQNIRKPAKKVIAKQAQESYEMREGARFIIQTCKPNLNLIKHLLEINATCFELSRF